MKLTLLLLLSALHIFCPYLLHPYLYKHMNVFCSFSYILFIVFWAVLQKVEKVEMWHLAKKKKKCSEWDKDN